MSRFRRITGGDGSRTFGARLTRWRSCGGTISCFRFGRTPRGRLRSGWLCRRSVGYRTGRAFGTRRRRGSRATSGGWRSGAASRGRACRAGSRRWGTGRGSRHGGSCSSCRFGGRGCGRRFRALSGGGTSFSRFFGRIRFGTRLFRTSSRRITGFVYARPAGFSGGGVSLCRTTKITGRACSRRNGGRTTIFRHCICFGMALIFGATFLPTVPSKWLTAKVLLPMSTLSRTYQSAVSVRCVTNKPVYVRSYRTFWSMRGISNGGKTRRNGTKPITRLLIPLSCGAATGVMGHVCRHRGAFALTTSRSRSMKAGRIGKPTSCCRSMTIRLRILLFVFFPKKLLSFVVGATYAACVICANSPYIAGVSATAEPRAV